MAYSNVTPPTLPSYDSVANPYYLIQFEYAIGAENWETVRFWFGAAPLTWNGSAVTNAVAFSLFTYGTGSPEWTAWGVMAEAGEMALTPGPTTADTYMRLYTNHDILDGTGAVWLAKGTVTPTEEDKAAEIQIRKKSQLAGIIAAWCAPVRQPPKPTAEPVAFLYNGVRLPGLPESTRQYVTIALRVNGEYLAVFSAGKSTAFEDGTILANPSLHDMYLYENGEWISTNMSAFPTPIWANYDMYYTETAGGGLFLATSEPIPVYE